MSAAGSLVVDDLRVAGDAELLHGVSLAVAPGEAVGPMAHLHSSKHLTVAGGACRIDLGGTPFHLHETQSLDVPATNTYRIENHGKVDLHLGWVELTMWAGAVGWLGVFYAVPLRRQMVVVERLRFPTGTATANTITAMFTRPIFSRPSQENSAIRTGISDPPVIRMAIPR